MTAPAARVWFKRDLRVHDHVPLADAMHFDSAFGLVATCSPMRTHAVVQTASLHRGSSSIRIGVADMAAGPCNSPLASHGIRARDCLWSAENRGKVTVALTMAVRQDSAWAYCPAKGNGIVNEQTRFFNTRRSCRHAAGCSLTGSGHCQCWPGASHHKRLAQQDKPWTA